MFPPVNKFLFFSSHLLWLLVIVVDPCTSHLFKFTLSARNLTDRDGIGTSDPYAQIAYTDGFCQTRKNFSRTPTSQNDANPNWPTIFEFDYDPARRTIFYVTVWDDDSVVSDDLIGSFKIDLLSDYFTQGQEFTKTHTNIGSLIMKGVPPLIPHMSLNPTKASPLRIAFMGQPSQKLRFKLSLKNLGGIPSTGHVLLQWSSQDDYCHKKEMTIKSTRRSKITGNMKSWDYTEVFQYEFLKSLNQKWFFQVVHSDDKMKEKIIAKTMLKVEEFVKNGEQWQTSMESLLNNFQCDLTIMKV